MKRYTFLLATVLVAAISFIFFSCSSDGGGDSGDIVSGKLTINNPPSGTTVMASVINYAQQLRDSETLTNLTITGGLTGIAYSAYEDPSNPISLLNTQYKTFSESGTFLVYVATMQGGRYFDQVEFKKGGAVIDWNANYFDGVTYVGGGSQTGNSSSGGSSVPGNLDDGLITESNEAWLDCYEDEGESICHGFTFSANGNYTEILKEGANWMTLDNGTWSASGSSLILRSDGEEETLLYMVTSATSVIISFDGELSTYTRTSISSGGGSSSSSGGGNNSTSSSSTGSTAEKTCSQDSDPNLIWDINICDTKVSTGGGWYYYNSANSLVEWESKLDWHTGDIGESWVGGFYIELLSTGTGASKEGGYAGVGFSWEEGGPAVPTAFDDRIGLCLEYQYRNMYNAPTCYFRINSDRSDYDEFKATLPLKSSKSKQYFVINSATFTQSGNNALSAATSNSSGLQVHCTSDDGDVYIMFYSLYWGTCN